MIYILYNSLANNKNRNDAKLFLEKVCEGKKFSFFDVRSISDFGDFFSKILDDDEIILSGGDGTLNHFVNDIQNLCIKQKIYFYSDGSGNDFKNDVEDFAKIENNLILLNEFLENLPEVNVNGMKRRFINGIGFGIDGYCCEEGDKIREKSGKPVNYTKIAIKGLLGKFKPSNAKVTVDGKTYFYKNVWLCPSMLGRFYGGGMMIAPFQNRLSDERKLTVVVCHSKSRLKTLLSFPSIFKGSHAKFKKIISFIPGHEIKVEFDKAQALQIDGETVKNVLSYTASFN